LLLPTTEAVLCTASAAHVRSGSCAYSLLGCRAVGGLVDHAQLARARDAHICGFVLVTECVPATPWTCTSRFRMRQPEGLCCAAEDACKCAGHRRWMMLAGRMDVAAARVRNNTCCCSSSGTFWCPRVLTLSVSLAHIVTNDDQHHAVWSKDAGMHMWGLFGDGCAVAGLTCPPRWVWSSQAPGGECWTQQWAPCSSSSSSNSSSGYNRHCQLQCCQQQHLPAYSHGML
jgi:hypothetical protein